MKFCNSQEKNHFHLMVLIYTNMGEAKRRREVVGGRFQEKPRSGLEVSFRV
jgi:hypothetical protein